jgi:hypothetical protein
MHLRSRSHLQRRSPATAPTPVTGTLKRTVAARLNREFGETLPLPLFRRALDEAEIAAHASGFPDLFFPALAEEKIRLVSTSVSDGPFAPPSRRLHAA